MVQICLQVWILLIIIFSFSNPVKADTDIKYYDYVEIEKASEKYSLNINDKVKKKNLSVIMTAQLAVNSNDYGCFKFINTDFFYKKDKLLRRVLFNDNMRNCLSLKNIVATDNNYFFEIFYTKDNTSFVTPTINFLKKETMSILNKTNFNYMTIFKHNLKTGSVNGITAFPMVLYDSNNHKDALKKMDEFWNSKFKNINDDILFDKKKMDEFIMKVSAEEAFNKDLKFYLYLLIADSEEIYNIYKDKNYLFMCETQKHIGGSISASRGGKILNDMNRIQKTELVFKNFSSNFSSFHLNNFMKVSELASKLDEVLLNCEGKDNPMAINIQTRN